MLPLTSKIYTSTLSFPSKATPNKRMVVLKVYACFFWEKFKKKAFSFDFLKGFPLIYGRFLSHFTGSSKFLRSVYLDELWSKLFRLPLLEFVFCLSFILESVSSHRWKPWNKRTLSRLVVWLFLQENHFAYRQRPLLYFFSVSFLSHLIVELIY